MALTLLGLDYLRSPTITPDATSCPNPTSMTNIVCALWRNKLGTGDGINNGEFRAKSFQVVIAGMSLTPPSPILPRFFSPWPQGYAV